MLSIGILTKIFSIATASLLITPPLFNRIGIILLLYSALLAWNSFYIDPVGSGIGLYCGLFHVTTLSQPFYLFILLLAALVLGLGEPPSSAKFNINLPISVIKEPEPMIMVINGIEPPFNDFNDSDLELMVFNGSDPT